MKTLLLCGLAMSLTAFAQQGSGYAPNDGTARPGNPGTFTTPKAGLGKAAPTTTGVGTDIDGAGSGENLEKTNTSPNPIPEDTTLQGKTQTGPYKTPGNKQSQESQDEVIDYRAIPKVDHSDGEGEPTDNQ